jgi:hypothetical protein
MGRAACLAAFASMSTVGCGSSSTEPPGSEATGQVTWNQQIAPIVAKKCVGCHQAGGIGPMSLVEYANAKHYAPTMLDEVQQGLMPPWGAQTTSECSPQFGFKDDPRLTADEQALLAAWVDQGEPEGPASTKPLPKPASTALENPDMHLTIPTSVEIAGTEDRFMCFVLDPGNATDRYLKAVQVNAGNTAVVHHVLVFADPKNESAALAKPDGSYECFGGPQISAGNVQLLGAWAPGGVPAVMPDNVALQLTGGSKVVLQVHYHPTRTSREVDDSTSVDFEFAAEPPTRPGTLALIGNFGDADMKIAGGKGYGLMPGPDDPDSGPSFVIPPNVTGHTETQRFLIPEQMGVGAYHIFGVASHMHYVGQDMKIEVVHENGERECLLQTPAWDFNWQRFYYYDAPLESVPTVHAGDVLEMRCTYDNSMSNQFVRTALGQQGLDVPIDVHLGENTLDEMCLGAFGIALEGG